MAVQIVGWELAKEVPAVGRPCLQPGVLVILVEDDYHPLLVLRLVVLPHERVVIGIDSQHRVSVCLAAANDACCIQYCLLPKTV